MAPAPLAQEWDLKKLAAAAFPVVAILVLGFGVYVRSLAYPLENLDEPVMIGRNLPFLTDFSNVREALRRDALFTTDGKEFYRPLQNLSYMLDAQLAQGRPVGFRLTNLLWHCLTCGALYWLLRVLKFGTVLATLLACVFAVHPLFTHVVVWTPSRGDILLALFGILALVCLIQYLQTGRRRYCLLHIGLTSCAIFSKETAVLLPALFLAYGFLVHRPKPMGMLALSVGGDLIAVFAYLLARQQVVKANVGSQVFGLEPLVSNLATIPEVVAKFFFPINSLSPMAAYSTRTTLLGLACITLLLLVISLRAGSRPLSALILFFGLWFLVLLVPGMMYRHELGPSAYDYLEHRAYLPAAGLVVIVAALIGKEAPPRLLLPAGALCLALFASLSYRHSQDYRNPVAFYDAVIRANPNDSLAHCNRGLARYLSGDAAGSLEDYDIAIRLAPRNDKAFNNRGNSRLSLNDFAAARLDFQEAIRLNPGSAEAYNGRGVVEFQTQQYAAALEDFTKAMAQRPGFAEPYNSRGSVYAALGDRAAARRDFEEALRLKPVFPAALANLNKLKEPTAATEAVPALAAEYNAAGIAKAMRGDFSGSVQDFSEAIRIFPRFSEALANRGNARHALQDTNGAFADWQAASDLGHEQAKEMLAKFRR